jgi:hypothetical protein
VKPLIDKMITLASGIRCMRAGRPPRSSDPELGKKLFDTLGTRFGQRQRRLHPDRRLGSARATAPSRP